MRTVIQGLRATINLTEWDIEQLDSVRGKTLGKGTFGTVKMFFAAAIPIQGQKSRFAKWMILSGVLLGLYALLIVCALIPPVLPISILINYVVAAVSGGISMLVGTWKLTHTLEPSQRLQQLRGSETALTQQFVSKSIRKESGQKHFCENGWREINFLRQLKHTTQGPEHIACSVIAFYCGLNRVDMFFEPEGRNVKNLSAFIRSSASDPTMRVARTKQLVKDMVIAVEYMHGQDMAHLDIKPENVLVCLRQGAVVQGKLCDLGFTTNLKIGKDHGCWNGTPGYIPPELYCSGYDFKAPKARMLHDAYSLGLTIAETVVGKQFVGYPPRNHLNHKGQLVQPGAYAEWIRQQIDQYLPRMPKTMARVITRLSHADVSQRSTVGAVDARMNPTRTVRPTQSSAFNQPKRQNCQISYLSSKINHQPEPPINRPICNR